MTTMPIDNNLLIQGPTVYRHLFPKVHALKYHHYAIVKQLQHYLSIYLLEPKHNSYKYPGYRDSGLGFRGIKNLYYKNKMLLNQP